MSAHADDYLELCAQARFAQLLGQREDPSSAEVTQAFRQVEREITQANPEVNAVKMLLRVLPVRKDYKLPDTYHTVSAYKLFVHFDPKRSEGHRRLHYLLKQGPVSIPSVNEDSKAELSAQWERVRAAVN